MRTIGCPDHGRQAVDEQTLDLQQISVMVQGVQHGTPSHYAKYTCGECGKVFEHLIDEAEVPERLRYT